MCKTHPFCFGFVCALFQFLNYALINRKEWTQKGPEMVAQYLKNYKALYEQGDESEYEDVSHRADDLDYDGQELASILEV